MAEDKDQRQAVERGHVFLTCHLLINALLIAFVANFHGFSQEPPVSGDWEGVLRQHQVFLEAILLTMPGWVLGVVIGRRRPRLGNLLGGVLIALAPLVYYADLMCYLILGERLFSFSTMDTLGWFVVLLPEYLPQSSSSRFWMAGMIWAMAQLLSLYLGERLSRRVASAEKAKHRWALPFTLGMILLPLAFRLARPWQFVDELRRYSERHPICATALIPPLRHEPPQELKSQDRCLEAHFLAHRKDLNELERRYRELAVTDRPKQQQDILLILIETLRYDAISGESAPNLTEFEKRSLNCRLHFSGGNCSFTGFRLLLYGLDAVLGWPGTQDWPVGLPRLLTQAGYYRAYVGTGGIGWRHMDRFLSNVSFDYFHMDMTMPFYERDRRLIEQATRVFKREPPFEDLKDRPVFVFVYLQTPHFPYHASPDDQVFTPAATGDLPLPPWEKDFLPLVRNRYLNSVHTVDRLIKPLLDAERVIIVTGDHGESFMEDGRCGHQSELSFVQMRTPLIVHVPGREPAELTMPTSHCDILPTLLDAAGITVNYPDAFSGRSLLDADRAAKSLPFALREAKTGQFALFGPYSQKKRGSTQMFHFVADLWVPRFGLGGAYDELNRPATVGREEIAAFQADIEVWLNRLLEGKSGHVADDPVPVLLALLKSGDMPTQQRAIAILEALGPKAKAAIPSLEGLLRSQDNSAVRKDLFEALVAIRKGD